MFKINLYDFTSQLADLGISPDQIKQIEVKAFRDQLAGTSIATIQIPQRLDE